jgi:exodeoxyribonuclease V beta subunit
VGVAPLAGVERSALGYLLSGGQPLPPPVLTVALDAMAKGCPAVSVQALPPADDTRYEQADTALPFAPEPALPAAPRARWWIASYSALRRSGEVVGEVIDEEAAPLVEMPLPSPASAAQDIYADSRADAWQMADSDDEDRLAEAVAGSLHAFPRGAGPGTFLHGLLEWSGRQGFARVQSEPAVQTELTELIARRSHLSGWNHWAEPLRDWLLRWLATPLNLTALKAGPMAPASLGRVQIEMEFWLAAQHVDTRQLDELVCRHTLDGAPRPALLPQQVNGMLKGFIDLVFEHEGRYFVADYKSNWLGPFDADYTPAALRDAVLHHRYELQYVLYVFALHRLLRVRLPDYDYERHIGGAVYIFLRGHAAPSQGLHCERPPKVLIESIDELFQGVVAA